MKRRLIPHNARIPVGEARDLLTLVKRHPRLLGLLRRHGIHFCAGCYLTLAAPPAKAAAYHGVPDIPRFLRELKALTSGRRKS